MSPKYNKLLLFGGTGSLGNALHHLWKDKVSTFVVFGRDESIDIFL